MPSRTISKSPDTPTAADFGEARVAHVGGDVTPRASVPPDFVHRLDQSHHKQIQFLQAIAHQLNGLAHRASIGIADPADSAEAPVAPPEPSAEVTSYLQRLDRFIREDAERRTHDWEQLASNVSSLQAQLAALSVAGLSHPSPAPAPPVTLERRPTNADGLTPQPAPGPDVAADPVPSSAPGRTASLLRRLKGSAPPPTTTDEPAAAAPGKLRKRSLSMPRVAGPRMPVRLWGGPRPADETERLQRWGGSQSGKSHTTEDVLKDAATFRYEPPADALTKLGLALDDAKSVKSDRGPLPTTHDGKTPPMPYSASAPDLRMRATTTSDGGFEGLPPSQSSYNVVAQDTMIQESLREVLAHLRARAMRDHEREAREADEAQRRANRLGDNDVDGQGHAELDESSKRQNALEKKAEAFDMRAREQRAFDCSRWRRLTLARRHRRGAAAPHNAGLDG